MKANRSQHLYIKENLGTIISSHRITYSAILIYAWKNKNGLLVVTVDSSSETGKTQKKSWGMKRWKLLSSIRRKDILVCEAEYYRPCIKSYYMQGPTSWQVITMSRGMHRWQWKKLTALCSAKIMKCWEWSLNQQGKTQAVWPQNIVQSSCGRKMFR